MNRALAATALLALSAGACEVRRERRFESVCQLIRREVVERDERGEPTQIDVELEWDSCPGDQFQVVRGGAAFARCMERYRIGDAIPVRVVQWWDSRGFFTWDVYRVGDCEHPVEPESEGSFELSQECRESRAYGLSNGFVCSRRPHRNLVSICPWMARN